MWSLSHVLILSLLLATAADAGHTFVLLGMVGVTHLAIYDIVTKDDLAETNNLAF